MNSLGDICPMCKEGVLLKLAEDPPWSEVCLICSVCDSTFNILEDK